MNQDKIKKLFIENNFNIDVSSVEDFQKYLSETPIDQFQTIGDFSKGSSFTKKTDRAILTSPKAIEKIKNKFSKTAQNFDMYFVNTKEARNHTEVGEVDEDFIRNKLKLDTPINRNNITVFYTNNKGEGGVMMTSWIIAHRFGHVVKRMPEWYDLCRAVNEMIQRIMRDAYDRKMLLSQDGDVLGISFHDQSQNATNQLILRNLYHMIGTFKSARDKKLNNPYEFLYELLAQYITTGKISFNPLPKFIPVKYAWGKPSSGIRFHGPDNDLEYYSGYLSDLAEHIYPDYAENLLDACVGKIFVM